MAEGGALFSKSDRSLSQIGVLVEVSPEKLKEVEGACTWHEYAPDQVIIDRADNKTSVYFLVKGRVSVMNYLAEKQQVSLAEVEEGNAFGELSAIDQKERSARVTAIGPCLIAELDDQKFRDLLIECPGMALALLKRLSSLIRTMTLKFTELSVMSPHQRIYHELLRMSVPDPSRGDGIWVIPVTPSHAELADVAGAERQAVAEAIGSLVAASIVERKSRSLVIKDRERLERLRHQH